MGVAVSVISMEVCMWQDRRSPLHLSLWRGHESVALCLMEQGANVNHRDEVCIFRICLFLKNSSSYYTFKTVFSRASCAL